MCSAFLRTLAAASLLLAPPSAAGARELRVCADPNNLPFSNERQEGFENRIARLIADQLYANLTYVWWAQRRSFIRNTLKAGSCDLVPGVMAGLEMLRTTRPYYRSTYVFAWRSSSDLAIALEDADLLSKDRLLAEEFPLALMERDEDGLGQDIDREDEA